MIVNDGTINGLIDRISASQEVLVDTETDGLRPWHGNRLCGIGVALSPKEGYYIPFRHPDNNVSIAYLDGIWEALSSVPKLLGYNLKFDLAMLYQDGYEVPIGQKLVDIIVAARLCSAPQFPDLSLSGQLEEAFGPDSILYDVEFKKFLTENKWRKSYNKAPADKTGVYCVGDVLSAWRLLNHLEKIIDSTLQRPLWEQEQEVTYTLWSMEEIGVGYDSEYGNQKIPQLYARIENIKNEIYSIAGGEFNLGSNPQMTNVMKKLKIKSTKKSAKTGDPSWDSKVLLSIKHPIAGKILEIRGLEKVLGTYFESIVEWPNDTIHGTNKNWGTITGRLAYSDPNLQNISKTTQNLEGNEISLETLRAAASSLGSESQKFNDDDVALVGGMISVTTAFHDTDSEASVRRLFIPRPDYRLYMLDYSQMEMRVLADYIGDPNLYLLLEDVNFDFHSYAAKAIWNANEDDEMWAFYRRLAKDINFGLIYGLGIKALAAKLQTTTEEAEAYKQRYFSQFDVASFMESVMETV